MPKYHFNAKLFNLLALISLAGQLPTFSQELGQSEWQTPNNNQYPSNNQTVSQAEGQNPNTEAAQSWQTPGLSQSNPTNGQNSGPNLGQSSWQNTNQSASQNQPYDQGNNNQANWQNSAQNTDQHSLGQSNWQTPGLNQNSSNGQSGWQQQPQSAFQANANQGNNQTDYYSGQTSQTNLNQLQPSNQNNNQTWQTQAPTQQGQVQKNQQGTLSQVLKGVTGTALTAARVATPMVNMYMYSKAMSSSPYGAMGMGMPYGMGMMGGMGGMMPYGYGMGMPATPYYPGYGGMSSFMNY